MTFQYPLYDLSYLYFFFLNTDAIFCHSFLQGVVSAHVMFPNTLLMALFHRSIFGQNAEANFCLSYLTFQVELVCDVSSDIERDTYDVSEEHSGLFIRDLFLQGAAWDVENDCLSETQ